MTDAKADAGALGVDVLVGRHIVSADTEAGVIEDETGAAYKITGPLVPVRAAEAPKRPGPLQYANARTRGQSALTVLLDGQPVPWWLEANVAEGWVTHNKADKKTGRIVLNAEGTERKVFKSEGVVEIRSAPVAGGNAGPENPMR